jgi:hypothetical protein
MQALIVFDLETAKRVRITVAGVGWLAKYQARIFPG